MLALVSGWDMAILVGAAYLALVLLVRLMRKRRDELVVQLRQEVTLARLQQRAARRQERKRQIRQRQLQAGLTSHSEQASRP